MTTVGSDADRRLRAVRRPRPVLGRARERQLTDRQRALLDELEAIVADGFADLTMAELAGRLGCSLRTLYALAPSRDELVLVVVDRKLWRIGRTARQAIAADLAPLDAVRAYLEAATVAVAGWTPTFARDLAAVAAAQRLSDEHNEHLFEVTRTLLDLAAERGDVAADIDTAAVARVLAGLGRLFTRPAVMSTLRADPKEAADQVVDLVLRGLRPPSATGAP